LDNQPLSHYAKLLNLTQTSQNIIDKTIINITELYLYEKYKNFQFETGYVDDLIEQIDVDFNSWTTDKVDKYLQFAFLVQSCGIVPTAIAVTLQTAYDSVVANSTQEELQNIRLPLLLIKESFLLLSNFALKEYFSMISKIVSPKVDLSKYEPLFVERWNLSSKAEQIGKWEE